MVDVAPSVAVVMAHYDDYNGMVFSIQHLRMAAAAPNKPDEFVVFDSSAETQPEIHEEIVKFCADTGVKLVTNVDTYGTSASRNAAIAATDADIVICIDCHVLINVEAIDAVVRHFSDPANRKNIVGGPLLYDSLSKTIAPTHVNPQWSSQMWGRWGNAWIAPNGKIITVVENLETHVCEFKYLIGGLDLEPVDFWMPTDIDIENHEKFLAANGFKPWLAQAKPSDVIAVPGQGLGCFAIWREHWPGFHADASGFGGEELCVHELYRQNGGQAVCLAGLCWWHRFFRGRSYSPSYTAHTWERVRNYVLWFNQLGLPLDDIKQHFITDENASMSESEWSSLVDDPVNYIPTNTGVHTNFLPVVTSAEGTRSIASLQNWIRNTPSECNEYVLPISSIAMICRSVVEFSTNFETTVGLLSCVGEIHSFNDHASDVLFKTMHELSGSEVTSQGIRTLHTHVGNSVRDAVLPIPGTTELLLLNTVHTGERITAELNALAKNVKRFIIICGTQRYGREGEGGGSSMMVAIRNWLLDNDEWYISKHAANQGGLTLLSRDPQFKPQRPVQFIDGGPGTELQLLLKDLDIEITQECKCTDHLILMNNLGSKGCREHLEAVTNGVRENKTKWGIEQKLVEGSLQEKLVIMYKGLSSRVGWLAGVQMVLTGNYDPVAVLVLMAIANAEQKGL